jgi:hypothetical protein
MSFIANIVTANLGTLAEVRNTTAPMTPTAPMPLP